MPKGFCKHFVSIEVPCDACAERYAREGEPKRATEAERSHVVSIKDSNPKDGIGIRKVPFHLVPEIVIAEVALGMAEGDLKYGGHNYRAIGVRASVYYSAARRHLAAFWEGEDIDPESQLSHITKALSTLVVLRDAMLNAKWEDDRPPAAIMGRTPWLTELNDRMGALLDRLPRKEQAWTARNIAGRLAARAVSKVVGL